MSTLPRPIPLIDASEIVSYDPATGEEMGRAPLSSPEGVARAVKLARTRQAAWAALSFRERGRVILRARQLVLNEVDRIATLISRETGKPVSEAISMEIVPTLDLMQYFARQTAKLLRSQKIDIGQYGLMGRSSRIIYKPLGVLGIISPWNFPWSTPLTGIRIGELFNRAGLPDGVLNIVTGDGSTGAALIDARVDKIMFTGSVATGKRVAAATAKHLTPVVLELGGKDPMIVLEDADLENAARGAVWGAFANSGQACASVERCYVQESIAPQFIERIVAETRLLKQNIGTNDDSDVGAMS